MEKISPLGLLSVFILSGCVAFEVGGEIQLGRMALLRGEPNLALVHFQRAAQSDPNSLANFTPLQQGVWTYVGRAYYAMGKLPEAHQALERATSRYEHDSLAKLYLGLTLIRQRKKQKTEKPFSLDDIIFALKEGIAPKRVATLTKERGVESELTSEAEVKLRRAGADDQLVDEIKTIRVEYARKRGAEEFLKEHGAKEVEAAMRQLLNWLDNIDQNTTYGRFWDPGGKIRSQIQANLAIISAREIDWQKLIAGGEWVGKEMEEEIDRARQDETEERRSEYP